MKVTAQKIAKEAGVSETTVSLVLNGRPTRISEQTKKRVLDVAKKFNYKSNQIAVSLATQRTKTLGLVLPNLTNPLFPRLAAGLEKEAQENGYALFLCNCEEKAELFLDYLETMQRRCIDGLVMLLPSEIDEQRDSYYARVLAALRTSSVPMVLVERNMQDAPCDFVCVDNHLGGELATEYLIRHGHQKIGHITGSEFFSARTVGYLDAMKKHGLPVSEYYIAHGDFSIQSGYQAAKELLEHDVSAIFACNDCMALGASRAVTDSGLRFPEDVSIIGFDDDSITAVMTVPLTTVRQPGEEMGAVACKLLLKRLSNSAERPETYTYQEFPIMPQIIERESVATLAQNEGD